MQDYFPLVFHSVIYLLLNPILFLKAVQSNVTVFLTITRLAVARCQIPAHSSLCGTSPVKKNMVTFTSKSNSITCFKNTYKWIYSAEPSPVVVHFFLWRKWSPFYNCTELVSPYFECHLSVSTMFYPMHGLLSHAWRTDFPDTALYNIMALSGFEKTAMITWSFRQKRVQSPVHWGWLTSW